MTTAVTKVAKQVKDTTSAVREHLTVVERARDIYLAGIKRLEAEYFDRIKRATEIVAGNGEDHTAETPQPAPTETPQPAPTVGAPTQ